MARPILKFRADAGQQIGWGHLMRCIAVAQMTESEFDIHFYCLTIPYKIGKELRAHGFGLHQINHEDEFLEKLDDHDLVILDGYEFKETYQRKIKNTGCKLIYIDDMIKEHQVADLVINHAPDVSEAEYTGEKYTRYLLGPDYALVRQPFLNANKNSIVDHSLLICFGGSDAKNLTLKTLDIAVKIGSFNQIHVVTGGSYRFLESITELTYPNVHHHHDLDANGMAKVLATCSHAIVPASGILYECLAAGLTSAAGYYVENQIRIYEGFLKSQTIIDAMDFNADAIVAAVFELSTISNLQTKPVIDKKSGLRILAAVTQLYPLN